MRAIFDERAMLQRWPDLEGALALGEGELVFVDRVVADARRLGA